MHEIIPAIIVKSFKELKKKIEKVEPYARWVHIDIMDGKFVPNTTWNNPEELTLPPRLRRRKSPNLEAHLMIQDPEKYVEKWIDSGINRIIFHIEAASSPGEIVKMCREKGAEVGVAINPETPQSSLSLAAGQAPLLNLVDEILVLGVTPGFGGQEFKMEALEKIKSLRKDNPHLTIGVDGGMNPKTAKKAVEAGASIVVAGSYIFNSVNAGKAIEELREATNF